MGFGPGRLLLQYVFAMFNRPHRNDDRHDAEDKYYCGIGDVRLQVIRDRQPPQVTREQQLYRLPSEDEDQATDQRSSERHASPQEQSTIGGESKRNAPKIANKRV